MREMILDHGMGSAPKRFILRFSKQQLCALIVVVRHSARNTGFSPPLGLTLHSSRLGPDER